MNILSYLEEAARYAKNADYSDNLDDVNYYGSKARRVLESINTRDLDSEVANLIAKAAKSAKEAGFAHSVNDGQYYGSKARKTIRRAIDLLSRHQFTE